MIPEKDARALLRYADDLDWFAAWLRDHGDRLIAAAALLGGPVWARRARKAVDAMERGARLGELHKDLAALDKLLHLEFVDDLESPEARWFLAVHPDDPRADDARLCAEAMARGVRAMQVISAIAAGNVPEAA